MVLAQSVYVCVHGYMCVWACCVCVAWACLCVWRGRVFMCKGTVGRCVAGNTASV